MPHFMITKEEIQKLQKLEDKAKRMFVWGLVCGISGIIMLIIASVIFYSMSGGK